MNYLLLIHADPAAFDGLDEEEQKGIVAEFAAAGAAPGVRDHRRLYPADTATTVRVQDGRVLTTDGPFIEAKEALGGLIVFEADSLDAAIELAASIPAARFGGAVEVRPIMETTA